MALVMTAYKFQMQMLSQAAPAPSSPGQPPSHLSALYAAHVAAPAHGNLSVAQLGCGSTSLGVSPLPSPLPSPTAATCGGSATIAPALR